jgi:hypothetical protein
MERISAPSKIAPIGEFNSPAKTENEGEYEMKITNQNTKNAIKAQIMMANFTMAEVVDALSMEYGWSDSLSNFSAKLGRGSLRYVEALQLADVMGYDIQWVKRRDA